MLSHHSRGNNRVGIPRRILFGGGRGVRWRSRRDVVRSGPGGGTVQVSRRPPQSLPLAVLRRAYGRPCLRRCRESRLRLAGECCPRSGVRGRGYAHQGAFIHAGASGVRLHLGICLRRTPRLRPQKAPARRRKSGLGCTYTCRVQLIRCSAANNSVGDSVDNRRSDLGFRPIQVGAGSFSVQVSTKLPTDGMSWLRSAYTDHKPVLPILRNVSCVSARAALLRQLQRREPTRRKLLRWVWRPAATLMTPVGTVQLA